LVGKKPRLEEHLPTTTDEATQETASTDVSERLNPPTADDPNANADPVTDTQPNAGATPATDSWRLEDDEKLTRAVTNTCKKRSGQGVQDQLACNFRAVSRSNEKTVLEQMA
jgi:hypothetical protein